jgi:hypothetical protein
VKIEKDTNSNIRKQVMIDWLVERNLTHDKNLIPLLVKRGRQFVNM